AFVGDIGITSPLFGQKNVTPAQQALMHLPPIVQPDISVKAFDAVVLYARSLAVPAARTSASAAAVRGRDLFQSIGCIACHRPELRTGTSLDLPELGNQTIRPYTDLLLHDMGEGLADNRPAFDATGREWRTPPLWGLGLISKVNGHIFLLHDGRA